VTHVVRGADLIDSTPRQIFLQRCLGMPTPQYLHLPVVLNEQGEKLSKQTGAAALSKDETAAVRREAFRFLGLTNADPLAPVSALAAWRTRYPLTK
jgi:glutamyl-Q tRNA(Asp) synthetase